LAGYLYDERGPGHTFIRFPGLVRLVQRWSTQEEQSLLGESIVSLKAARLADRAIDTQLLVPLKGSQYVHPPENQEDLQYHHGNRVLDVGRTVKLFYVHERPRTGGRLPYGQRQERGGSDQDNLMKF